MFLHYLFTYRPKGLFREGKSATPLKSFVTQPLRLLHASHPPFFKLLLQSNDHSPLDWPPSIHPKAPSFPWHPTRLHPSPFMAINNSDTLSFRPMSDVAYHPSGRRSSRRGGGRRDFVAGDIVEVSCYILDIAVDC